MEQIAQNKDFEQLVKQVARLIEAGRDNVRKVVNTSMVYTYYGVGYYIVEFEQGGKTRAEYGKETLKQLSARLTEIYGDGWSVETLKKCRFFFSIYSTKEIGSTVLTKLPESNLVNSVDQIQESQISKIVHSVFQIPTPSFPSTLSWSHYLILMRIKNPEERSFYEIECSRQMWSVRQLQRQYNSSLYERLALSKNKSEVMRLANEGQIVEKSDDVIKNPFTLEFLGLKPASAYSENKLETMIINKMRDFLLEMGRGFLLTQVSRVAQVFHSSCLSYSCHSFNSRFKKTA